MITTFLSHRNPYPSTDSKLKTWDDLKTRLSDHQSKTSKTLGEVWSPNIYRPNTTRGNASVDQMTLFVADLDGHSLDQFMNKIKHLEWIAYTTWSHTKQNPHWRVVIRLDRFIPADAWEKFWHKISSSLFANLLDGACKDPSRVYWFPTHDLESTDFEVRHNSGESLKVDEPIKKTRTQITQDATDSLLGDQSAGVQSRQTIVDEYITKTSGGKDRHKSSLSAVMKLLWKPEPEEYIAQIRDIFVRQVTEDGSRTLADADREFRDIVTSAKSKITKLTTNHEPDDSTESKPKRGKSVATMLVELAEQRWRFTVGEDGKPFAIPLNGTQIAKPLGRGNFRSELASHYFAERGIAANSSALADAIAVLEGKALQNDRENTFLRYADLGDRIFVDLGTADGKALEVTAQGWTQIDRPPIIFRRNELTAEMISPITGGNLNLLRQFANVSDESFQLLVGWMVAVIRDIPRPILLPMGAQGTGKSALAKRVVSLLDPSPAPLGSPPDINAWQDIASASHIVAIDNISRISPDLSDALCRAVTGDGMKKRTLYTDSGITVSAFKRAIILTSIDTGAIRGDLGERLLLIPLETIPDAERRSDTDLAELYNRNAGQILGGVLDLVSRVLAKLESIEIKALPRMADFAKVLGAIDEIMGWTTLTNYLESLQSIEIDLVNTDEVAIAVITYFAKLREQNESVYLGTIKELYDDSHPRNYGKDSNTYPRQVSNFGQRLSTITPALKTAGILVERLRTSDQRKVKLTKVETMTAVTAMTDDLTFNLFDSPTNRGIAV